MPRANKTELLHKDLVKAMDLVCKAQAQLEKALGRFPKNKQVMIPVGSKLYQRYGASCSVQQVLKDLWLPEATNGYEKGVLAGGLDVLEELKALAGGECEFKL